MSKLLKVMGYDEFECEVHKFLIQEGFAFYRNLEYKFHGKFDRNQVSIIKRNICFDVNINVGFGEKQINQTLLFNKDNFFEVYEEVLKIVSTVKYMK